jgi:CheY-like chemotaxis protein
MKTRPIHLFLVDDDEDDAGFFEQTIKDIDPQVHFKAAQNGQQALDLLRSEDGASPDLIFLDLNMPVMDGKQCLQELKADPGLSHIPVIIYTTSSQSRDIEEAMINGAVCFITKPSSLKELQFILATLMNSLPHGLQKAARMLSNESNTFIVSS